MQEAGFVRLDGDDTRVDPAEAALDAAREEAERIVAAARAEADAIRKAARKEGREQGLAEGRDEGRAEFTARVEEMAALVSRLARHRGEVLKRQARDLFELVRVMVERICLAEMTVDEHVVMAVIRAGLDRVVNGSEVVVFLNPEDHALVEEGGGAISEAAAGRVRFEPDPEISRGGCRIKSGFGEIDATFETRRNNLFQAVDAAFVDAVSRVAGGEEEGDDRGH